MRRPRRWAVGLVNLATSLLPPGAVRDRYRHELEAELWDLGPGAQLRAALSAVWSAPALHRALVESGALEVPHSPVWCRARLHHRWVGASTEDGRRFRRCRQCGCDNDGVGGSPSVSGSAMLAVGPSQ